MWRLTSQTINKEYYANLLSRSSLIAAACCLFAFIVPILILVSIGYSWNRYSIALVQPKLSYENHQISCLLSDSSTIYDSTFTNQNNNYRSFLAVGGDDSNYGISANIIATNVVSCSILVYFRVTVSSFQSLAVLPLQFTNPSSASPPSFIGLSQTGIIYTKMLSPIPQSTVGYSQATSYYYNSTQILNMNDIHATYAAKKNLTLIPSIVASQPTFSSTAKSFSYIGKFYVPSQSMLQQVPLLTNLRTFIPYFIYLFILMWVFVTQPTVRWMLQNKIYRSRVTRPKVKYH